MPRPLGGAVYSGLKPSPFEAVERSEMEGQYTALTDHSECGTFSFGNYIQKRLLSYIISFLLE